MKEEQYMYICITVPMQIHIYTVPMQIHTYAVHMQIHSA
jgi:hypothetical protein